jgi:hypothetical protein
MLRINFVGVALREEESWHCFTAFQPANVAPGGVRCVRNPENIGLGMCKK